MLQAAIKKRSRFVFPFILIYNVNRRLKIEDLVLFYTLYELKIVNKVNKILS